MGLKTVPWLAPDYGEAAIPLGDSLGKVSFGLKAGPYIANRATGIAQKVDHALPFGSFGDLATSSRYITREKTLRESPNIKRVV